MQRGEDLGSVPESQLNNLRNLTLNSELANPEMGNSAP